MGSMNRFLPTAFSLLIVGLAVQLTTILSLAGRWLVIGLLSLAAAIASFTVFWKYRSIPQVGGTPDTVPTLINYLVTWKRGVSLALALTLSVGVILSAYNVHRYTRHPSGTIFRLNARELAAAAGDSYLFRLDNVKNISSDLIWFELTVPLYSKSYAQTYLYYYTQASSQFGEPGSYAAELDINNYGPQPTKNLVTAFACPSGDTQIKPGTDHADIRKQAGCDELDHVCVLLPACKIGKNCQKGREVFTEPSKCNRQPVVGAATVPPLPTPSP
jgi:hypothetical protein